MIQRGPGLDSASRSERAQPSLIGMAGIRKQGHAVAEPQAPRRRPGPNSGAVVDGEAPASDRLLNQR